MSRDRSTPCLYYICAGQCRKGRDAEHNGYCQKCDKYKPRVRERHLNEKKKNWRRYGAGNPDETDYFLISER